MNRAPILRGEALATAYAKAHPLSQENPDKVWARYDGGGWLTLRGEGIKAHADLAARHPRGWSLLQRVRSGKARADMASGFAALRASYAQ